LQKQFWPLTSGWLPDPTTGPRKERRCAGNILYAADALLQATARCSYLFAASPDACGGRTGTLVATITCGFGM